MSSSRAIRSIVVLLCLASGVMAKTEEASCKLTVAVVSLKSERDPIRAVDWWSKRFATLQFDTLIRFTDQGELVPYLAERWYFSEDNKRITFHLKQGVFFSDGSPLTAKLVIDSLKRYVGELSFDHSRLTKVSGFDLKDDFTFDVILKRPFPLVLYYFATPRSGITKHSGNGLIGTGPWIRSASQPSGKSEVFLQNPFRQTSPNACHSLELTEIPFNESIKALKKGIVDIVEYFTWGEDIDALLDSSTRDKVKVFQFPTYDVTLLLFTWTSRGLSLPERKWLANALYNNPGLVTGTNRRLACAPLPLGMKGCQPPPCRSTWWPYPEKEVKKPKVVTLYLPSAFENRRDLIERIGSILSEKGVAFYPHFEDMESLYRLHAKGKVKAHLETFTIQIPDAFGILSMYQSGSAENFSHFSNSNFDELLDRATDFNSEEQRLTLYQKALALLNREAMMIPLVHESRYALVSYKVQNYSPSSVGPFYSNYEAISKQK